MYATRAFVRTDLGSALCLHDPHLQISEGILYRNGTGSMGDSHNTGHLPALFCRHILWGTAGQPASARYAFGLLPIRLCESGASLRLYLRVCQSPLCEHHRAAGARKRCGLCRNRPEPADHVKRAGGRRAGTALVLSW